MSHVDGANGTAAQNNNAITSQSLNSKQDLEDHTPTKAISQLSIASQAIHADDYLNSAQDVAPPMHVSTTFRYAKDPDALKPLSHQEVWSPVDSIGKALADLDPS